METRNSAGVPSFRTVRSISLGDTPQGTIEYRTIFAVGMLLFVSTFGLNLISTWLRNRFREEYA